MRLYGTDLANFSLLFTITLPFLKLSISSCLKPVRLDRRYGTSCKNKRWFTLNGVLSAQLLLIPFILTFHYLRHKFQFLLYVGVWIEHETRTPLFNDLFAVIMSHISTFLGIEMDGQ